jgi:hypothetical protein
MQTGGLLASYIVDAAYEEGPGRGACFTDPLGGSTSRPDTFGEPASNVEDFLGSFLLLRKSASGWRLMFIVKRMAHKWVA